MRLVSIYIDELKDVQLRLQRQNTTVDRIMFIPLGE
jgi:hypothetical protein